MSNAKLLSFTIERFKSFETSTRIDLAPLTIVLGRNNSGKSSLIQSLLLLKQTLIDPRMDIKLKHEGVVNALNLRELTFGWPTAAQPSVLGPTFVVEWECDVNVSAVLMQTRLPDLNNLAKHSGVQWLATPQHSRTLRTRITIETVELDGDASLSSIKLQSLHDTITTLSISFVNGIATCEWNGRPAPKLVVEFDHFIPFLRIDRSEVASRSAQRAWHNAYLVLFAQPLADLKQILIGLQYLGSGRDQPLPLYRVTAAPNDLGERGEFAAHLLHRRRSEIVHFLPLLDISAAEPIIPVMVHAKPLVEAVNKVLEELSVNATVHVQELQDIGFRLMFGDANINHVGRGLGYLLPLIEIGLFADPLRFTGNPGDVTREEYVIACDGFTHVALEEPEAHLHPKVASKLAHWLVSLALSNRRLIVETHSDHLVRRLRGLVARAGEDSELETWLLNNVVILSVEQDGDGRSCVSSNRLTADGGFGEDWPADFMDESTDEESAIYYAKLNKTTDEPFTEGLTWVDSDEPDIDEAP